jgi:hypothetical protein
MRRVPLLGLLVSALVVARASAQTAGARSTTQRFFAGLALNATRLDAPKLNDDAEYGGGATIIAGYGFSDRGSAVFGLTASDMRGKDDAYSLLHLDIGMRYHFANASRPLVPFVDVGMARRSATRTDIILTGSDNVSHGGQLKMSGTGFTVGGGVNYYVRPRVAVSTAVNVAVGDFTDLKFTDESQPILSFSGTTTRFNLGVVWFPQR